MIGISYSVLTPFQQGKATIDGRSFSAGEVSGSIIVADDFGG